MKHTEISQYQPVPAEVSKRRSKIKDIIKQITECIDWWECKRRGPFSWVDDCLFNYVDDRDFCYYFHAGWIPDWDKTERAQLMNVFLRKWITEVNIATVLRVTEEWKEQTKEK